MYSKKHSNKTLGQKGEAIIKEILVKKEFEIIDTNVQIGNIGEIDVIGKKNNVYHFVEVKTITCKTRAETEELPFYNITQKKQKNLERLAKLWMGKRNLEELYQIDAAALIYVGDTDTWMYKIIENISW